MSEAQGPKKGKGKKKAGAGGGGGGFAAAVAGGGPGKQVVPASNIENSLFPPKPPRPQGYMGPGNIVGLITNLFRISSKDKIIYRYTIEIESSSDESARIPRKIPNNIRQAAVQKAIENWIVNNVRDKSLRKLTYSYVLDTNASTMFALFDMDLKPSGRQEGKKTEIEVTIQVPFKEVVEDKTYTVKIHDGTPLNVRNLMDYCTSKGGRYHDDYKDHIRALNVIFLGQIITVPRYMVMQNAKAGHGTIFPLDHNCKFEISEGVVANKGFTTSVRPTESGLVLNVANTVMAFYKPLKLTTLLSKKFQVTDFNRRLSEDVIKKLSDELEDAQVEATHINYGTKQNPRFRKYRVGRIGSGSVQEVEFDNKGTMTSVFDFFREEHRLELQFPNLPCVVEKNNGRQIPLELCQLVDKQKVQRKLDPLETSKVIREAAMGPKKHFDTIQDNLNGFKQNNQSSRDFGLEIDQQPIHVTGRELPPIKLQAGGQLRIVATGGVYWPQRFIKPTQVIRWSIVCLVDDSVRSRYQDNSALLKQDAANFSSMYARAGFQKGVKIQSTEDIRLLLIDADLKKKLVATFEDLNSKSYDLALFVLPESKRDWIRSYLQYLEVTVKGTQKSGGRCTRIACLKFENFKKKIVDEQRGRDMFLSNLWLKHNTKLGGVNFALDRNQDFGIEPTNQVTKFLEPGYLFVSVDVCHPAPNDRLKQSVAAVVGLWNLTNPTMSCCTRLRCQRKEKSDKEKSTMEEVGEIGVMFREILEAYKIKQKGALPTHVVILRDGVSEGQFKMVLYKELVQIKAVLENTYSKLKIKSPLLTCLTVQKRHKVRFIREKAFKDIRSGREDYNIQPGTVVDADITQPNSHSFYLAPHKAIQGTARAPHIFMIYDEIKFSQDSAQAMIHALSYLSPRCTKGISIPTPVNLADLAAERGKNFVVIWNEEHREEMTVQERLNKLNGFLSTLDKEFMNGLFYV